MLALFKGPGEGIQQNVAHRLVFSFSRRWKKLLKLSSFWWGAKLDILDQKLDKISSLELEALHFVKFSGLTAGPQLSENN